MPSIYLIRHGQASFGQQNYDQLSPLGEQQARCLGRAIGARLGNFDQICKGSMYRHQQTAELCLAETNANINAQEWHSDPGWNEYDHQDILAQLAPEFSTARGIQQFVAQQPNPKKSFEKLFNDAMNRWMGGEFDSDYVESWTDYQCRIKTALAHILSTFEEAKKIAVFTSGGPISVISQHLLGVPANNIMQLNWTLVNCGVTKVISTGNRTFVSSLNEHTHFEGGNNALITYK